MTSHTIIFGGTRGSGRAFAVLLAERGEAVTVVGRRQVSGAELGHPSIFTIAADITDPAGHSGIIASAVAANGPWTAAAFFQKYRGKDDPWEGEWKVSIDATRRLIELLSMHAPLPEAKRSLVVVGSIAGRFIIQDQPVSYHAAKAALEHMVRAYAVRLGPLGIRVNMLSPHLVLKEESAHFYEGRPDLLALFSRIVPLGRMARAQEIAQVADFLCSDKASYVTGQNLVVDGGISLSALDGVARTLLGLAP